MFNELQIFYWVVCRLWQNHENHISTKSHFFCNQGKLVLSKMNESTVSAPPRPVHQFVRLSRFRLKFFVKVVFIRPSFRRDVLWYTVVRPSVCLSVVHTSDNNSKTLSPISMKLKLISIDVSSLSFFFNFRF